MADSVVFYPLFHYYYYYILFYLYYPLMCFVGISPFDLNTKHKIKAIHTLFRNIKGLCIMKWPNKTLRFHISRKYTWVSCSKNIYSKNWSFLQGYFIKRKPFYFHRAIHLSYYKSLFKMCSSNEISRSKSLLQTISLFIC